MHTRDRKQNGWRLNGSEKYTECDRVDLEEGMIEVITGHHGNRAEKLH